MKWTKSTWNLSPRSALTSISSDRRTECQSMSRAWGGPKPEPFVNERPWLCSQDKGLFQSRKGSVGLHSQLRGGLRTRFPSCFALWPTTAACIRFIWYCHVQSNHMPVLKVYNQVTKDRQFIWHAETWLWTLQHLLFRAHREGEKRFKKKKHECACQHTLSTITATVSIFLLHFTGPILVTSFLFLVLVSIKGTFTLMNTFK